jgi:hypothetical protein
MKSFTFLSVKSNLGLELESLPIEENELDTPLKKGP